jgi:hypothetical protein
LGGHDDEENEMELQVDSEEGNELSKDLDIVFKQPERIRPSKSLG